MKQLLQHKSGLLKRVAVILLSFFFCEALHAQQNIDSLEYDVDNIAAFGQSLNKIPVTPAAVVTNFPFTVNIAAVPNGIHTLLLRSHSSGPSGGRWSETNYTYFYKQNNIVSTVSNIQKLEYFIDNDPGEGNAVAINVTPAIQVSGISFNPNISALVPGFHVLFIRSLDQNGKWSISNYTYFYKQNNIPAPVSTVTKMEYFVDTDPGEGNGHALAFAPATAVSGLGFNADISTAAAGFHVIFIRSLDANGKWSITNYAYFFKGGPGSGAVPNIVKIEYFIDNDPGYFAANNIPVVPATDIANKSFSADISAATPGLHYLYVRSLDSKGLWSVNAYDTFRINSVVPVTLISFNALAEKEHVNVTWQTALEQSLSNFEVQRAADGFHFTPLGSVAPLNAATGAQYLFKDDKPLSGINYYRLKTTENSGRSSFSNIRAVIFSPAAADYAIFPNPADRSFTIRSGTGSCSAEIINGNGILLRSLKNIKPNDQISTIDLPAGLYVVRISSGSQQTNLPLVIIH